MVADPVDAQQSHQQNANVTQCRVNVAHQVLEAHEAGRKANEHGDNEYLVEALRVPSGQARGQGEEHAQCGVEDHAVNSDRHEQTQRGVNVGHQGQHRQIGITKVANLEEEDQRTEEEQSTKHGATDQATDARNTGIEVVAADNDRHGHDHHEGEADVVQGRNPVVGQRALDFCGHRLQRRQVARSMHDGVHSGNQDQDDDARGDRTNNLRDLIDVKATKNKGKN